MEVSQLPRPAPSSVQFDRSATLRFQPFGHVKQNLAPSLGQPSSAKEDVSHLRLWVLVDLSHKDAVAVRHRRPKLAPPVCDRSLDILGREASNPIFQAE